MKKETNEFKDEGLRLYGAKAVNWECPECHKQYVRKVYDIQKAKTGVCKLCAPKKRIVHGQRNKRIYRIYYDMLKRCNYKNHISFPNYGEKGITVCPEWSLTGGEGFMNFFNWAIDNGYDESDTKLTLDRIDSNGNYEPENCQWLHQKFNYGRKPKPEGAYYEK